MRGRPQRSAACEAAREALPEGTLNALDALLAGVPTRSLDGATFQARRACCLTLRSARPEAGL